MSSNPTWPAGVVERSRLIARPAQPTDPAVPEASMVASARVAARAFAELGKGEDMGAEWRRSRPSAPRPRSLTRWRPRGGTRAAPRAGQLLEVLMVVRVG